MSAVQLSQQVMGLRDQLASLGYQGETGAVIPNYEFVGEKGRKHQVDLIAFADSRRHDISTACIVVYACPNGESKNEILRQLSYIGAPLAWFAYPDYVEFWPIVVPDKDLLTKPLDTIPYDALPTYFSRYERELSPLSLLNAKKKPQQLTWFDVDPTLELFARQATQETLVLQFQEAVSSVPENLRRQYPRELSRMAIWTLAARILQDKLVDDVTLQTRDVFALLDAVRKRFPNYFGKITDDLRIVGPDAVRSIYEGLSQGFTFRSITNDVLAYFYENTWVGDEMRKELGIYYTPRYITERILRRLPIEDLPPEQRTILDGTCGSGNMLLAGYDRLYNLLPVQWSLEERHNYLLRHIWGIDKDEFACEVARLSLLLYALPAGDSWQVKPGDVFDISPQDIFNGKPNIIVGNPPFEDVTRDGLRYQKAAKVLEVYLDWLRPGGYLGLVLPRSFLSSNYTKRERQTLLSVCDILEVWHLPEQAILDSTQGIAVVLAQKKQVLEEQDFLTRVLEIPRYDLRNFREDHNYKPSISYTVSQSKWRGQNVRMTSSRFQRLWQRLESNLPTVDPHFCEIWAGVQPSVNARKTHYTSDPNIGWRRVLHRNTQGQILEPYSINWARQKYKFFKYPSDELDRPRDEAHFERSTKIVINAIRNSDSPWRFYAAIDQDKLVIIQNFHYVLLSQGTTINELCAVFNSMLANAWYSSYSYNQKILTTILKKLPYPQFSYQQKEKIQVLVQAIVHLKSRNLIADHHLIRRKIQELDNVIFDAYGVSQVERTQIKDWMNKFARPGQEWNDFQVNIPETFPTYQGKRWIITGQVEDVDAEREMVIVEAYGDPVEIPIPPTMPGWALRPGATFRAEIPWEQAGERDLSLINWLDFQPLGYSYLSEEDLISEIAIYAHA